MDPTRDVDLRPEDLFSTIRAESERKAKQLRFPVPAPFPELRELTGARRNASEIVDRALCLYCVLLCLFSDDAPKELVRDWLQKNAIALDYSPLERRFLLGEQLDESQLQSLSDRVEALYALCWAVSKTPSLPPDQYVPEDFDDIFPDVRKHESKKAFAQAVTLKPAAEMIAALDLYYVLHWGLVQSKRLGTKRRPGAVDSYVIVERRQALEWIFSDEAWDDISLDT